MKTKPLYVLVSDGGDGSSYPRFTLSTELIQKLEQADEMGYLDFECAIGCDGDGFHYSTIMVPEDCTPETLKISVLPDNYADRFFEGREDDE